MILPDDLSEQEIANIEHHWVKEQLEWCDLQIKLHNCSDNRATSTLDNIYKYSKNLRDYTTVENGQAKINTEKPTL